MLVPRYGRTGTHPCSYSCTHARTMARTSHARHPRMIRMWWRGDRVCTRVLFYLFLFIILSFNKKKQFTKALEFSTVSPRHSPAGTSTVPGLYLVARSSRSTCRILLKACIAHKNRKPYVGFAASYKLRAEYRYMCVCQSTSVFFICDLVWDTFLNQKQ
jgi:hypothetical protein